MKRKKVFYPKARPGAPAPPGAPVTDPRAIAAAARTVSIDLTAIRGESKIRQGDRVRIQSGLYEGELATVESVIGGVIPAAVIRTDAGRSRRVRAVDLVPAGDEARAAPQPEAAVAADSRAPAGAPPAPDAPATADLPSKTDASTQLNPPDASASPE